MRVTAANVDIPSVVPALRRVFQKIDCAYREAHGAAWASRCRRDVSYVARECGVWHESDFGKRTAGPDRSRSWRCVVDQVGALQVNAVRAEISDLKTGAVPQAFFDRTAPLLEVLRRRMRVHRGKADCSLSQHRLAKVEVVRQD